MTFFRTLPDTLQQPAALAMLGSVGAHLIFFATLPAFTSSTEPRPEAEVRRVRLLEPPQGSAAPQAARSQLGLPPVPKPPNSKIQVPQVPQSGSGESPLPNPLYTIPSLTPLPIPNPPQLSIQDRIAEINRRIAARQQLIERRQQIEQQQRQATIKTPKTAPTQPPEPTSPVSQADPKVVAGAVNPQPSSGNPPTTPPSPSPLTPQTENDRILASLRYSPEGTTQQEGIQAQANLAEQLNTQKISWGYERIRQPGEPLKELDYPLSYTPSDLKQNPAHPVAIAIFVGKDGKPLTDPKPIILNSTGYKILNDKAIEVVQKDASQPNRFLAISEDKIRVVVYEFKFKAPNAGTALAPQP